MWYFYVVQVFVVLVYVFDFVDGLLVVGIGVDEYDVFVVVEYVDYVFDYLCDDVVFYLCWYYDCQWLFWLLQQVFLGQWLVCVVVFDGQCVLIFVYLVLDIDEQVIEVGDQDQYGYCCCCGFQGGVIVGQLDVLEQIVYGGLVFCVGGFVVVYLGDVGGQQCEYDYVDQQQ